MNEALQVAEAEWGEGESGEEEQGEDEDEEVEEEGVDDYASLRRTKKKPVRSEPAAKTESAPTPTTTTTTTTAASTVRHRFPSAAPTPSDHNLLFNARPSTATTGGTEQVLDSQRSEQESLTADLLTMAQVLKNSSVSFGQHLEDEKAHLSAAAEGLGKNAAGLDATAGRMVGLQRDDKVGFVWSLIYGGVISVLVLLVLVMLFLAPKLRW